MKKILCIVGCLLVLGSSPVLAVAEEPSVVLVRTYENGIGKPQIVIVRDTGAPEVMRVKYEDYLVTYRKVIADLYAQGYTLQSSMAVGEKGPYLGTMIFVKAAKP
ncbi:hypothetical protein [Hymenobacter wooponensis]|uniref:Uncharacterized protein n=1 Tax=Hymenobacter wooponensis TaxID=1525360 RepID=A0A4Z0MSU0_9BACT|nr:hypothetical protein [Hymenobacter wooponensis]TGD82500.1 hypothetical protein EU557_01560 [Hymenobacter wooponensis]